MIPFRIYAGLGEEYSEYNFAKTVLIPVPYDGTSTWGKGADKGPEAFFDASDNMEIYDIETDSQPYQTGVFITEPVSEDSSPEAMCDAVEAETLKHLKTGKIVTLFGGEHSISIGAIRAFAKQFPNLSVLHLDAHSDLRPEYNGSACSHACALHNAQKITNLIQVGIRSMDVVELPFMKKENVFFAHQIQSNPNWISQVVEKLGDTVYITIDLDAFDPSILPGTGTPEPGGLLWYQVQDLLKKVFATKNVVGWDINELAPIENMPASEFFAAKLYYRMLAMKFS